MADSYSKVFQLINNNWEIYYDNSNGRLPDIPLPSTQTTFQVGDKFSIHSNGGYKIVKVEAIECHLWDEQIDRGWVVYYFLNWTGSGHTGGYFTEEQLSPSKKN